MQSSSSKVIARVSPSLEGFLSSSSAFRAMVRAFDDEGRNVASEFGLSAIIIWLCSQAKSSNDEKKENRAIKNTKICHYNTLTAGFCKGFDPLFSRKKITKNEKCLAQYSAGWLSTVMSITFKLRNNLHGT